MKKLLFVSAMLCIMLALASCRGKSDYKELTARTWKLEKIIHVDSITKVMIPANVHITFADSTRMVFGRAGCNNFFGQYETGKNNSLTIDNLGSTMMLCPEMYFEDSYLALLKDVVAFSASADEMKLRSAYDKFTLIYRPDK